MTSDALVPLIQLSRGGTPECLHFGAIAVVNRQGQVTAMAGNPHLQTFTRSTLKALQALPFVASGGHKALGYSQAQVAMLCASHNGEAVHAQAADDMLHQAGLSYKTLRCGCHVPGLFTLLEQLPPADLAFDERHNNCSGKHAGFLGHCVQQGWSLDDYIDPMHPLQQAVRKAVASAVSMDEADMKMGIDGCSAPNYAMPLSRLAYGYARLASDTDDDTWGESFAALAQAMTDHPEMVSGTGRNDLALMQAGAGDWVTKIGADGVQVVASKSRGEAFAIKISDGNKPALYAATVEALSQLGWLNAAQRATLEPWRNREIRNARQMLVGERSAIFQLSTPRSHP